MKSILKRKQRNSLQSESIILIISSIDNSIASEVHFIGQNPLPVKTIRTSGSKISRHHGDFSILCICEVKMKEWPKMVNFASWWKEQGIPWPSLVRICTEED